jgi:hypothetical protein
MRKKKGQALNRFPGYGFTWEKSWDPETRKRVKVRVANPEERAVMRQIVKWRLDDYSWDEITAHLFRQGVRTKDGTKWTRARVIRVFRAELALQDSENRNGDK